MDTLSLHCEDIELGEQLIDKMTRLLLESYRLALLEKLGLSSTNFRVVGLEIVPYAGLQPLGHLHLRLGFQIIRRFWQQYLLDRILDHTDKLPQLLDIVLGCDFLAADIMPPVLTENSTMGADPHIPTRVAHHIQFLPMLNTGSLFLDGLLTDSLVLDILDQLDNRHILGQLIRHALSDDSVGLAVWTGESEPGFLEG